MLDGATRLRDHRAYAAALASLCVFDAFIDVENVGDFEFVMSWSSTAAPKTLRASKLALLDSLTER